MDGAETGSGRRARRADRAQGRPAGTPATPGAPGLPIRRCARPGRGREPLPPVHRPAGRDVAPDGARSCWPAFVALPASCPSPRCRRSTTRPSRSSTFYPGASPDVMASRVTAPLERQFGQLPGPQADDVDQLERRRRSSRCSSTSTLSIDVAEQEVQAAINAAATFLPRDLPNPPVYSKVNPADAPVLTLGAHLEHPCRSRPSRTSPTRGSCRRSRSSRASGLVSLSAAARSRRCASRSNPAAARRQRPHAWTTCASPSPPPTSTRRRAASTDRASRSRSRPTTRSSERAVSGRSSIAYRNSAPAPALGRGRR